MHKKNPQYYHALKTSIIRYLISDILYLISCIQYLNQSQRRKSSRWSLGLGLRIAILLLV